MITRLAMILKISVLAVCLAGCSQAGQPTQPSDAQHVPVTPVPPSEHAAQEENLIPRNTSEPFMGRMDLDQATEEFIYGTWKVDKLLGFANSYNDASEYPTGQDIIGDELVIQKDYFSSMGLEGYEAYQYEFTNPRYSITQRHYNRDSFYRVNKLDLSMIGINDEMIDIEVTEPSPGLGIPLGFLDVNHNKLILWIEAATFELIRVDESGNK
ncbi:hypothetical protein [Paenibacillus piscarius]|uniref:hypothetical protein n=1 Tax=Paenibacillus piscarius TaxID=1089681 RepID=UPI001EE79396|nr:hypothetical protein [Paenibacillus piscarius]